MQVIGNFSIYIIYYYTGNNFYPTTKFASNYAEAFAGNSMLPHVHKAGYILLLLNWLAWMEWHNIVKIGLPRQCLSIDQWFLGVPGEFRVTGFRHLLFRLEKFVDTITHDEQSKRQE